MAAAITQDVIAYDKASKVYNNVGGSVNKLARDTNKANDTIRRSSKHAADANQHFARVSGRAFVSTGGHLRALGVVSAGAFAAAAAGAFIAGKSFVKAASDQGKANRQTAAVIKSTGGAANVTAKQVGDLAGSLSALTGIQDDTIQSTENMLLTFKNVRNQAGKNNDIFTQATKVVTDMSVALGQDGAKSAIQLGKALNDPITGITALQRVGVTFTEKQKKTIKTLVDSGKTLAAQKIILKELSSEFGGSAAAQATAGAKMAAAWDQVKESIGNLLLPVLNKVADWFVKTGAPAIQKATAATSAWVKAHWTEISGVFQRVWSIILPILKAWVAYGKWLYTVALPAVVNWVKEHWPEIQAAIKQVVDWIVAHWPQIVSVLKKAWAEIQPVLVSLGQLFKSLWQQIIKPLVDWIVAHWPQIQQIIKVVAIAVGVYLIAMARAIRIVAAVVTWMVNNIWGPQFRLMLHIVSGTAAVIIRIWNGIIAVGRTLGSGISWAWHNVIYPILVAIGSRIGITKDTIKDTIAVIQGLWKGIGKGLATAAATVKAILNGIASSINAVKDALDALANRGTAIPVGTQTGFASQAVSPYKPRRAAGGPVSAMRTYQVNERGEEFFTPTQSGTIIPAGRWGGGGVYINEVHVHGVQSTSELWQSLQKYAKRNGSIKLSGVTA